MEQREWRICSGWIPGNLKWWSLERKQRIPSSPWWAPLRRKLASGTRVCLRHSVQTQSLSPEHHQPKRMNRNIRKRTIFVYVAKVYSVIRKLVWIDFTPVLFLITRIFNPDEFTKQWTRNNVLKIKPSIVWTNDNGQSVTSNVEYNLECTNLRTYTLNWRYVLTVSSLVKPNKRTRAYLATSGW